MRGVKRLRHHPKRKLPVSWALLTLIIMSLDLHNHRHMVVAAGLLIGWFFGTRISELIAMRICSIIFYNKNGHVLDLKDSNLTDNAVELDVKFGKVKNDQAGVGTVRSHYMSGLELCCVKALARMIQQRVLLTKELDPQAPLFSFFDKSATSCKEHRLSREIVARTLKAGAAKAGIPEARVSCHSLRSGAAVAMLRCGCSYEDTRCFFRWRSDVARIYLRSVRGAMRSISVLMAAGSGMNTVLLTGK